MCAIGGIYLRPGATLPMPGHLQAMLATQRHRGPDAEAAWLSSDGAIGLCHSRLAILDLSEAGTQPMHSSDGRHVIVFNGEIYNHVELRQRLADAGHLFQSHTDTEVLLAAYRHWGEDMLTHLRGMFAFAIYDGVERALFCARDRIGKKPFVFAQTQDGLVFASEIPAVRLVPGVDTRYDPDALAAMLLHNMRHIPDPHTAYQGIKRLRAGHAMRVKDGRIEREWRYWTPTPMSGDVSATRLRSVLEEAVSLRAQADVPVGALLSGGVDSSAICALMQQRTSAAVHTYALGLDEADEDLRRARIMAAQLKTRHREFYFNPVEQWDVFARLIKVYGEPIMLLPLINTYVLCRAIRDDGIKVVLTGNGADELFYGYTGHIRTLKVSRWLDRMPWLGRLPKSVLPDRLGWLMARAGHRKAAYYESLADSAWQRVISEDMRHRLVNRATQEMRYWGELSPSSQFIDESNFIGLMIENTHSVTIAGDLPAMAASVEIRSPFLDQDMMAFAFATEVEKKIPDVNNPDWLKAILRDAVKDLMPENLLKAPKRGFGMGIQEDAVLRGAWRPVAQELLEQPDDANGLFCASAIRQAWHGFLNRRVPANEVSRMLAMQVWLTGHKDHAYQ